MFVLVSWKFEMKIANRLDSHQLVYQVYVLH